MLHYLARGVLPPRDDRGGRTGLVEAFSLKHAQPADALAELRRLWEAHADEIRAATPAGTNPWILEALRSPDKADEREEAGDEDT